MKKERLGVFGAFIAIVFALFIISAAVILTLNFRPLYYYDIQALGIPESSDIPAEVAKENYDALIDYNLPFFAGELEFPSFAMSEQGRIHFAEVKSIFATFYMLFAASFALGMFLLVWRGANRCGRAIKASGILAVAVPALLALLLALLGWDRSFEFLHQVFFDNDFWLFDPATDPVILILSDEFFLHCLVLLGGLVVLFAGVAFAIGRYFVRKK